MILISVGTSVQLNLGKVHGIITAACIRDNEYVSYEVSYNLNGEPKTTWHISKEFEVMDSNYYITVGFQNGKTI